MGMANMRMPLTLQLFCPLLLLDVPAYRIGQQPTSPTPFYCLLCLCPIPTPSPSPLPQTASAPPSLIRLTPPSMSDAREGPSADATSPRDRTSPVGALSAAAAQLRGWVTGPSGWCV